jgi:hypothetical protein
MNGKIRLAIILCMILSSIPFFAEDGKKIMSLPEIDSLIKDTSYDKALTELYLYIEKYPEDFDAAQKRIRKIMDARNKYTVLANTLIDVIQNDPQNDEKILALTNQLEALERHPSEKQLAFIRDAKVAAQFNYYRLQFTEIMKSSAELTHQRNYGGSVDTVRTGFYMYQDDFFDQNTARDIVEPVKAALGRVDKEISAYKAIQVRLDDAVNAFVKAVRSKDIVQAQNAFGNVETVYAEYAAVRNSMCSAGWRLKSIFESMKKSNPDLTDASFLPFISRLLFGIDSIPDSGIVVAMDYEWEVLTNLMKNEIFAVMTSQADSFRESVSGDLFAGGSVPSRQPLDSLIKFASLGNSVNGLYALLKTEDGGTQEKTHPDFVISLNYAEGVSGRIIALLSSADRMVAVEAKASSLAVPADPGEAELAGNTYAEDLLAASAEIEKMTADDAVYVLTSSAWAVPYVLMKPEADAAVLVSEPENVTKAVQKKTGVLLWDSLDTAYRKLNDYASSFEKTSVTTFWGKAASYYALCGTSYTELRKADFAALQKLYNGVKDGSTGIVSKYPQESLTAAQALKKAVSDDKAVLVKAQSRLSGGKHVESYMASLQSVTASIAVLDSLNQTIAAVETGAAEQIRLAKRAQNEADLRYSQAGNALASNDFDTARKRLQEARTKYNESLSYQESAVLRKNTDTSIASLGNEILTRQNEVIVRQVRSLKTKARNEYYNGNFDSAENFLTQAKTLWAVTNIDEDEEITNLLALVNTALSMKTGRVIPPAAPLYPEMSQILSIAQQYFKQGSSLLDKGKTEEGKAALRLALQKLQELQLVYPLNQDASLLTLRIQRILDPAGFKDLFAKRVDTARDNYKIAGKQQSSYTDLLDLYEINPSYPGLKQLIYNVEIDLGIRQKPVDRTALVRSKSLTAEAQRIVEAAGRDEVKLQSALSHVDEAIRLNPDNDEAMLLKDRIQTSIGGKAAVVLSSEDEAKYQQAITEMQNNNIVTANALVEQLLQKQGNRRSSKILDLQKKIKALL